MLKMIWDSLAPIGIIGLSIVCMMALRDPHKTRRVWKVFQRLPARLEAAWKGSPRPVPIIEDLSTNIPDPVENLPSTTVPQTISTSIPLQETPNIYATVKYMQAAAPQARYLFPYGWFSSAPVTAEVAPDLAFADLEETYNITVISPPQYGKTSLVLTGLMALTLQRTPNEIQFVIIDLKDVDFRLMEHSEYTFLMIRKAAMVASAFTRLHNEMDRRSDILASHRISTWSEYRGDDLPLIVVYVSELLSLIQTVGKREVDCLLSTLMSRGGTLGFRVIIDTYSLAYLSPIWRKLLSEHLLGPGLESLEQDYFNTDLTYTDILAQGAIPPSQLMRTNKGVFTAISDTGKALTVRIVHIPTTQRQQWFETLSTKEQPPKIAPAYHSGTTSGLPTSPTLEVQHAQINSA